MKATTLAISAAILLATTAAGFASCNGKHRMSCAEGFVYDASAGGCVAATVSG